MLRIHFTPVPIRTTSWILWIVAVILATYGATKLIYDSWNRYNSNPTVISLEKDFREWNLTFPAVTLCFRDRLNETKAADYILQTWNTDQNSSKFDKYFKFLNAITNLTYDNLEDFKEFADDSYFTSLTGEQLADIALQNNVEIIYNAIIFDPSFRNQKFKAIVTEMGMCYTYSGIVSHYQTLRREPLVTKDVPYCNYLSAICYCRVEDLPRSIRYYIHSPYEVPALNDKYLEVLESMERDTTLRFNEMVASTQLRRLEPRQRQCRFVDEPLKDDQLYSYNLCKMGCRKRMAYKLCGCAPFFYQKSENIPLCNVKGLNCISMFKDVIIRTDCKCLSQCEYVTFSVDENLKRTWSYPIPPNIRFRWAIQHYSKTRQKRDIIFGFEDLLVSLGGTAALFLGCSVLSFVEVGYFFSLRLFWHVVRRCRPKKKKNTMIHRRRQGDE